jgi:hypothetical protein
VLDDQLELKALQLLGDSPDCLPYRGRLEPDNPVLATDSQTSRRQRQRWMALTLHPPEALLSWTLCSSQRSETQAQALVVVNEGCSTPIRKGGQLVTKTGLPAIYSQAPNSPHSAD